MNKFSGIIQSIKNMFPKVFKKKKGEDEGNIDSLMAEDEDGKLSKAEQEAMETDTPEAEDDMLKGKHKKILGLSRPVVFGIFGILFLVFMGALVFNMSDDSSTKTEQKQDPTMKQQIAGNQTFHGSDADKLSDDYGELQRANAKKAQANGNQTVQAQRTDGSSNSTAPASNTVHPATTPSSSLPAVPRSNPVVAQPASVPASYSQPYTLPSSQVPAAQPASSGRSENEQKKSLAQELKTKMESAIAFATGRSDTSTASTDNSGSASSSSGGDSSNGTASATTPVYQAPANNVVTAGTLIPVMLLTGINTDSPAQVMAQVMGDVYSLDGNGILIPAGSRILGTMDGAGKANSSGRVSVTFDQLVTPDGGTWNIGKSMVAVDGAGYTGIQGNLHRHTGTNIARGLFNSALQALSTINVDKLEISASDILPTLDTQAANITVDPGYQFTVYVTNNIAF